MEQQAVLVDMIGSLFNEQNEGLGYELVAGVPK